MVKTPLHIINRRQELGLTQQDVAESCGTIQQTVAKLESGSRKLSIAWAEKLAIPLRWTPSQVLFGQSAFMSAKIIGDLVQNEAVVISGDPEVVTITTPINDKFKGEFQAVRVTTDALEPRFFTGDLLIFGSDVSDLGEASGKECLIEVNDDLMVRRVEVTDKNQLLLRGYRSITPTLAVAASNVKLHRLLSIQPN